MRCLHVVDSLAATPHACALLALLKLHRSLPGAADDIHDVLGLAGGDLEPGLTAQARRLYIAGGGLDVAAVVHARAYDVVHAVDAVAAHHVAPLVVAAFAGAFVYSGRALASHRHADDADPVLLAATDLSIVDPADSLDPLLDVGGHLARLELSRVAALSPAEGSTAGPGRTQDFVLREWLALLVRSRIPAKAAA
jgi:hypothetical protein